MTTSVFAALLAVTLVQDGTNWTVGNKYYKATYDAAKNGLLTRVQYGDFKMTMQGGLTCVYDGQQTEFDQRTHYVQRKCQQSVAGGTAKVLEQGERQIRFEFSWPLFDGGKVVEQVTFDNSPTVRYSADIEWVKTMGDIRFRIQSPQALNKGTTFYPEARRFVAPYDDGECSMLPRWRYVNCGQARFGLAGADTVDWSYMKYAVNYSAASLELRTQYLADEPAPGRMHLDFAVLLAQDLGLGCRVARQAAGKAPRAQLANLVPDKVFNKRGEKNGFTTTVINNLDAEQAVKVAVELASGFDDVRKVSEETLVLKPYECRVYHKDWSYAPDFEWGVTTRVTLSDPESSEKLDYRADVTTVNDRAVEGAGCGIVNAAMCFRPGDDVLFAEQLARNYIGMCEYYCWSPSTWDPSRRQGMAPSTESWIPCTEAPYNERLTRKLVKGFVDECHKRGIHVYSWITGLCNAQLAYAHPEMFQYCPDGQLCIYNGTANAAGRRRLIAKLAPYDVEVARAWGEEMADSVDMFGWDGCRWDWGWVPNSPNDPRYHDELLKNPKLLEWFNWKGESCVTLYPDPDDIAYKCLKVWRETVLKRHPDFVDSANLHCTPADMAANPKYMDYRCRDCHGLNEYCLDVAREYPTFAKWGAEITCDAQTLRTRGSQCEVGFMRGFNQESASLLLARSVCHASGTKWWGGHNDIRFWGSPFRSQPFAMRFGEWFFGLDLIQVPAADRAAKVTVLDDAKLYWKEFVYERTLKDGRRELVVHVINVGADDYIMPKKTIVKRSVTMKPALAKGEKSVECRVLKPGIEPLAFALSAKDGAFTLDELEEAAVFVFRFSK